MHAALTGFHPLIAAWFGERIGAPSAPQALGWPLIRAVKHTLIAAPTGTGKTFSAFLVAIDALASAPAGDGCRVLYLSPLRALANDIAKNLTAPLAELAERGLPRLRVAVRTGDTTAKERQGMARTPPHLLATTPESLYLLLTSAAGRHLLSGVRTVIVDEIHAVIGTKRGAHLATSLERLEALIADAGNPPPQRIGLSATVRPLDAVARFLGGVGRDVAIADCGHLRDLDLGVLLPDGEISAVCSNETWGAIYERATELIQAHRTTLIFTTTRRLAERLAVRLGERLGEGSVLCHHGSLSKERRLAAEHALKTGALRALVATATLELGIDIGDVDLVLQVGSPHAIHTFLQRAGRAGHGPGRLPKARLVPLTRDELVESAALLAAVRTRDLEDLPTTPAAQDVLAQQLVAACVARAWPVADLHALLTRAAPFESIDAATFQRLIDLHAHGRLALLHHDTAHGTVRATKRARLVATTCGGAIPDAALFTVRQDPDDLLVGTVDEDFAIESMPGEIFLLGTAAWRILAIDSRRGVVRVAAAPGAPPGIPFWFGEAPGRTQALSQAVGRLRAAADSPDWLMRACGLDADAATRTWTYLDACRTALGQLPTHDTVIAERFSDDTGGQHLVLHACASMRVHRAWGLALRKRFCTGFGFELEAAATDEGLLLSLAPGTGFDLKEVFSFLTCDGVEKLLTTAVLTGGQLRTRWRWTVAIALVIERASTAGRTPPHLLRIRADDALQAAFPNALACADNIRPDEVEFPRDHPIVAQALDDCLRDLMDLDGLKTLLTGIRSGRIAVHAVETPQPSPLAEGIVSARPYAFLDDVPLEERRVRAIAPTSRLVEAQPGDLDADALATVAREAWPDPQHSEELAEVLAWIGHLTDAEVKPWQELIAPLAAAGRAVHDEGRWFAPNADRTPLTQWRCRLEAVAPVDDQTLADDDRTALIQLETQGVAARARCGGRALWLHRRLLARCHRLMRDGRRHRGEPIAITAWLRFAARWQGVAPGHRRAGPVGLARTLTQLAALELPATAWPAALALRVSDIRPDWIDQATHGGAFAWGRLWGSGAPAAAMLPVAFIPRGDLDAWLAIAGPASTDDLDGNARAVIDALDARGALFLNELHARTRLLPEHLERAVLAGLGAGLITADSFATLRWLLLPSQRRGRALPPPGRLARFRPIGASAPLERAEEAHAELAARTLLDRCGVAVRATWERERIRVPWRDVLRALRLMELRGTAIGGRFVAGLPGEQYALPDAVALMARDAPTEAYELSGSDPLNYTGCVVPGERVRPEGVIRVA